MRRRFDQQLSLGATPISEVKIRIKGRDEMPPVLLALQTMFTTPELNEKIFLILEDKILKGKKIQAAMGWTCGTSWY